MLIESLSPVIPGSKGYAQAKHMNEMSIELQWNAWFMNVEFLNF
jgi:hypothetical protein